MLHLRIKWLHKSLIFLVLCYFMMSLKAQMLTPFTFHDIQRRMGDLSSTTKSPSTFQSGALKTFQSKAREIFQTSTENYAKLHTSASTRTDLLPLANVTSKVSLGLLDETPSSPVDDFKTSSFDTQEMSLSSFDAQKTLQNPFETTKTLPNPFEASLNDPSSFVSSLTSLHLHLSEQSEPSLPDVFQSQPTQTPLPDVFNSQTADNESATIGDLFAPNFDFPDSEFGSQSDIQTGFEAEKMEESGRGFPSIGDSLSEEGRNTNFFANPFQFSNPLFGGAKSGLDGQATSGSHNKASVAHKQQQYQQEDSGEELARDGGGHGHGSDHGGGFSHSVHIESGGYGHAPVHEEPSYGHEPIHEEPSYGHAPIHESTGYGHEESGGYAEPIHEGGYSDHHQPGYVASRHPGPYGYPTPNFKCEYVKETLYVSKSEWTYDEKCFTIYKTDCKMEYDVGKDIGYKKECNEFTVTKCRTEYDTSSETKCKTIYRKECGQIYITKVDWEYEEKCEQSYEEVCHGYGYEKKCDQVPKEMCHQVPVKVEKQVPKTECKKVPDKKCTDFPIFIPRKACKDFPKTVCVKDPINVPKKIPKKVCYSVPKEVCNKIPVQIIKHVPKTVTKKVCVSTKPSGYGHVQAGYSSHSDHHGFSSDNVFSFAMPPNNNNNNNTAFVNINNNSTSSTVPKGRDLEEIEPEIYYDEVEESDYLNEDIVT